MNNLKHTKAIGSDGFKEWLNDTMDKFLSDADSYKILSSMDKGVDSPIVEISYRNEYNQDGNNKRILLCEYGNGSNLWSIDFDDSLIDLEPSEILGFGNYKKEKKSS